MKKAFGIILIIIGLICIPQVFSPSAAETIGGLIGVSLFTFLPAYFLLRRNSKANKIAEAQNTSNSKLNVSSETYWQGYKKYYLNKSFEIEKLTELDFSILSNIDAREKVQSLERWSNNTNTPISQLKQHFLNTFIPKFTFDELPEVLNYLPQKKIEEANIFNISEQNTSSYWMIKWLDEYINTLGKNELDDLSNNEKNNTEDVLVEKIKFQNNSFSFYKGDMSDTLDCIREIFAERGSDKEKNDKVKALLKSRDIGGLDKWISEAETRIPNFSNFLKIISIKSEAQIAINKNIFSSPSKIVADIISTKFDNHLSSKPFLFMNDLRLFQEEVNFYKNDYDLMQLCRMSKSKYEELIDKISMNIKNKYTWK